MIGLRRALYGIFATVLAVVVVAAPPAQALTFKAIQDINTYKPWYDKNDDTTAACPAGTTPTITSSGTTCCATATTGTISTTITGGGQVDIIMNYLHAQGFTLVGAAATVGNMEVEGAPTLKPNVQEGDRTWPLGGWGLIQWTAGRRLNLIKFISDPPYSLSRLYVEDKSYTLNLSEADNAALMKAELDFYMKELTESYSSTLALVKDPSITDAAAAATKFESLFEGCTSLYTPEQCSVPTRIKNAQGIASNPTYISLFQTATPAPVPGSPPTPTGSTCGGTTTPVSTASAGYGATGAQLADLPSECLSGTATGSVKFLCVGAKYRNLVPYLAVHPYTGEEFSKKWAAGGLPGGDRGGLTLDCSLFIGLVLYDAFGVDFTTDSGSYVGNTTLFKQIPLSEARTGDFFHVTNPDGHIGIVDVPGQSILDTGWTHPTSPVNDLNVHSWNNNADYALRYIGPGSTP